MAFGKLGARGGFGSLGGLGKVGSSANAFSPLKAKLKAGQNAVVFVNADSTGYAPDGPFYIWAKAVGAIYNCTVNLYLWAEWNVSAPTGPKAYATVSTIRSGSAQTLTIYLCSLPGAVSGFPFNGSRKAAALDAIPTPDVAIIHHGHNMSAYDQQYAGSIVTSEGLFLSTVGMTSLEWLNVPQVVTSQNPDRDDLVMDGIYASIIGTKNNHPNLTFVDTYAGFIAQNKAANLYRTGSPGNVHPSDQPGAGNFDGAQLQANTLLAAFNAAKTPATFTTPNWPKLGGANLLENGDLSNWSGALPVNVFAQGSATITKDTTTKYGAAAYSAAVAPGATNNAYFQYFFSANDWAAMQGKTISLAVLFLQPSTQPRAFFNLTIQTSDHSLVGYVTGDLMDCQDGWYLAVFSNINVANIAYDFTGSLTAYPCFSTVPTVQDPLRIQKIFAIEGSLPHMGL